MKLLCWICVITTLFSIYLAITQSIDAFQYKRTYEAFRGDSEAFKRTIGRPIDNAFTCKLIK